MKIKGLIVACLGLILSLASCNKEDGFIPAENGERDIYLKFGQAETSRAVANPIGTKEVVFAEGALYFVDDNGKILHFIRITEEQIPGVLKASALTSGTVIQKVNGSASKVYVYGNSIDFKDSSFETIAEIETKLINLISQQDDDYGVENATLFGIGTIEKLDNEQTHSSGAKYNHQAKFDVSSIIARLEVDKIQTKPTSDILKYTLSGIYINNYYFEVSPSALLTSTLVNHGSDPTKYYREELSGAYKAAWYPFIFDDGDWNGTAINGLGTSTDELGAGNGKTWAFNVFANASAVPHIIFHFTDVELSTGLIANTVTNKPGEAYLTVTGYTDASTNGFVDILGGRVYKMENILFDEDDLGEVPEKNEKKDILVEINLVPWTVVKVNANFD